ncbi:hypothetical protein [Winogradskyella sediminis]|uniref:Uncharacterized protein n=1 Tax=Winogradskyella sediminis TaxID=1382466 RepID=A0A1H1MTT5_9FLAO|nr:hypothetical protein [Winogradskyella sediminis]SDR90301.1 hypothetical protein SAMN04489797_0424 [Winogradskyella sediminis]
MASNLEIYKELLDSHRSVIDYDSDTTKEISFPIEDNLKDSLKKYSISSTIKAGKIFVEKTDLPFSFFIDAQEFKNEVKKNHLERDCVIHNYNESFLFYDSSKTETFYNETETLVDKFIFDNSKTFFEAKEFFRSKYNYVDGEFAFTDFYSDTDRIIGFSLLHQNKRLVFKFPVVGLPNLDFEVSYKKDLEEFIKLYTESKHHPTFLKNALISNLIHESENHFCMFFNKLKKINLDTKLNFNVYLHELSLDKIKAEYKEYKKKYYGNQNDILNKISSQVLALPVSVAGSAFAIYKLKESVPAIVLICVALVAFVSYVSYIASIYWNDIINMNKQMDYDFSILKEHPFFEDKENKSELTHFEDIYNNLKNRVNKLKTSLNLINGLVWVLNIGLIIFGLDIILNLNNTQLFMIGLIGIGAYVVTSVFLIFTRDN